MESHNYGVPVYNGLGAFMVVISVIGAGLNATVAVFFYKLYKKEGRLINILIVSTAISDLLPSLLAYPATAVRTFKKNPYTSENIVCKFEGFCIHLTALTSVIHLAAMAFERYSVIKSGTSKIFSLQKQCVIIIAIWMYSGLISSLPFMGWSKYYPEGFQTSCTVNWKSKAKLDISYNSFLMFSNFVVPLTVITYCYIGLYKYVRSNTISKRWTDSEISRQSWRKRMQKNKNLAGMVFLLISMFLATWTPYVILSLYHMIAKTSTLDPLLETIPAIFAKSFTILNPLVYGIKHHKFRAEIAKWSRHICRMPKKDISVTSDCSGETFFVPSTELSNSITKSKHKRQSLSQQDQEPKNATFTNLTDEDK